MARQGDGCGDSSCNSNAEKLSKPRHSSWPLRRARQLQAKGDLLQRLDHVHSLLTTRDNEIQQLRQQVICLTLVCNELAGHQNAERDDDLVVLMVHKQIESRMIACEKSLFVHWQASQITMQDDHYARVAGIRAFGVDANFTPEPAIHHRANAAVRSGVEETLKFLIDC